MAGVLLLGLVPAVAGWDNILLSESLSCPLLVLTVAALILISKRSTSPRIAAALTLSTLWMFTRQGNVTIFLALLVSSRRKAPLTAF